eukprot:GILJ01007491.1.p1 GENE.GILJ01007491.1~~GILJ01007491.1.p1  ORF type:complete len:248 (+),score=29.27 GILJ01007491.1:50-745(+)
MGQRESVVRGTVEDEKRVVTLSDLEQILKDFDNHRPTQYDDPRFPPFTCAHMIEAKKLLSPKRQTHGGSFFKKEKHTDSRSTGLAGSSTSSPPTINEHALQSVLVEPTAIHSHTYTTPAATTTSALANGRTSRDSIDTVLPCSVDHIDQHGHREDVAMEYTATQGRSLKSISELGTNSRPMGPRKQSIHVPVRNESVHLLSSGVSIPGELSAYDSLTPHSTSSTSKKSIDR